MTRSGNGLAPSRVLNAVSSPPFSAAQNSLPGFLITGVRREAQTCFADRFLSEPVPLERRLEKAEPSMVASPVPRPCHWPHSYGGRSPASSLAGNKKKWHASPPLEQGGRRRSDHKGISPLRFDFSGKPRFGAGEKTRALVIRREHPHDDSENHADRKGIAGEMLAARKIETCRRQDSRREQAFSRFAPTEQSGRIPI